MTTYAKIDFLEGFFSEYNLGIVFFMQERDSIHTQGHFRQIRHHQFSDGGLLQLVSLRDHLQFLASHVNINVPSMPITIHLTRFTIDNLQTIHGSV